MRAANVRDRWKRSLEYLWRKKEPFLLWVDASWDPHEPWDPPPWHAQRYLPDYDGTVVDPPYDYIHNAGLTESDLEIARALLSRRNNDGRSMYRSAALTGSTTSVFRRNRRDLLVRSRLLFRRAWQLFGKMTRSEPVQISVGETVPVMQHPAWKRSPLYEEAIHVPLFVALPAARRRGGPTGLVSAVDLMPTLLELSGVGVPFDLRLHGRSLLPVLADPAYGGRDFTVASPPLVNPGEEVGVVTASIAASMNISRQRSPPNDGA